MEGEKEARRKISKYRKKRAARMVIVDDNTAPRVMHKTEKH